MTCLPADRMSSAISSGPAVRRRSAGRPAGRAVGLGEVAGHQPPWGRVGRDEQGRLLGPGGEHREQVRVLDEPPRAPRPVRAEPEGRDDDVPLVALEGVDGPDPQVEGLQVVDGNAASAASSRASAWARNGVITPTLLPARLRSASERTCARPRPAPRPPRPARRWSHDLDAVPGLRRGGPGRDADGAAVEPPGDELDQVGGRNGSARRGRAPAPPRPRRRGCCGGHRARATSAGERSRPWSATPTRSWSSARKETWRS